jgi:predicted nucleotidyltransferase
MTKIIQQNLQEVQDLCRKHRVLRFAVFGSGVREDFDDLKSDLDFLVEFKPMSPSEHKDAYFSLLEDLEQLFPAGVDLVELQAVRNPFVRRRIENEQETLYDAA